MIAAIQIAMLALLFAVGEVRVNAAQLDGVAARCEETELRTIVSELVAQRERLTSVEIEFVEEISSLVPRSTKRDWMDVTYAIKVAAKGDKRSWFRQTVANRAGPVYADSVACSFDGTICTAYRPGRRYARQWTSPEECFRAGIGNNWHKSYLELIGLWPYSAPCGDSCDLFLPQVFALRSYSVFPHAEKVDAMPCVVLAAAHGVDVMWLDPAKGYAIRRRILEIPDKERGARRKIDIKCWDFRYHEPGIWLPSRVSRTLSLESRNETGKLVPFSVTLIAVNAIRINSSQDADFKAALDPGTVILNMETRKSSFLAGGEEFLDAEVAGLSRGLGMPRPSIQQAAFQGFIVVACGSALLFLGLVVAERVISRVWRRSYR